MQFAPVDRVVATASNDKTIKLWALADGTCLKTLEGHTAGVLQLAFMTYGTQVGAGMSGKGWLCLWSCCCACDSDPVGHHNTECTLKSKKHC